VPRVEELDRCRPTRAWWKSTGRARAVLPKVHGEFISFMVPLVPRLDSLHHRLVGPFTHLRRTDSAHYTTTAQHLERYRSYLVQSQIIFVLKRMRQHLNYHCQCLNLSSTCVREWWKGGPPEHPPSPSQTLAAAAPAPLSLQFLPPSTASSPRLHPSLL
jgi:hypothetical protein